MARANQEVKVDTHVLQLGDIVEFPWPPFPDQGDGDTQHGVYLDQADDEFHDIYVRSMQKSFRVRRCDISLLIPVSWALKEAKREGWRAGLDDAIAVAKDSVPRTSGSVVLTLMALKARGPKEK